MSEVKDEKSTSLSKWDGPIQATPYPIQRISPLIEKNLAQVEQPVKLIATSLESKLSIIEQQIQHLQQVADKLILDARKNVELHLVPCSVSKRPGNTYHLFERLDGSKFFSIISPEEWGDGFKLNYIGSYHLDSDMSWKENNFV